MATTLKHSTHNLLHTAIATILFTVILLFGILVLMRYAHGWGEVASMVAAATYDSDGRRWPRRLHFSFDHGCRSRVGLRRTSRSLTKRRLAPKHAADSVCFHVAFGSIATDPFSARADQCPLCLHWRPTILQRRELTRMGWTGRAPAPNYPIELGSGFLKSTRSTRHAQQERRRSCTRNWDRYW